VIAIHIDAHEHLGSFFPVFIRFEQIGEMIS
jgi:hypothetical protein